MTSRLRATLDIAWLTWLEAMRRQIHLFTLFFVVVLLLLPLGANVFGLGASERVVKDVGLTILGYYGVALALFFGSSAVPGDVERKVALPLLTRPLSRGSYLWGKWLGIAGFVFVSQVVLLVVLEAGMLAFLGHGDPALVPALLCYMGEGSVLIAGCMACSTRCSPPLAGVLGAFAYILGGLSSTFMKAFLPDGASTSTSATIARLLKSAIPDFGVFHLKDAVVHGVAVPTSYVAAVLLYAVAWTLLCQVVGDLLFARRDL